MHLHRIELHIEEEEDGYYLTIFYKDLYHRLGPVDSLTKKVFAFLLQEEKKKTKAPPSRTLRRRSQRQERKLAEDVGARVQPGSGSLPTHKGDVRKRGEFRVESKYTSKKSYSVTREVLQKIRGECTGVERPALDVLFTDPLTGQESDRWVMIPYEDWVKKYGVSDD